MQFQGRELKLGDVLLCNRGWVSIVEFAPEMSKSHTEIKGYLNGDDCSTVLFGADSRNFWWPPKREDREAEYRRLWIECAMRAWLDRDIKDAFAEADAFIAELRKRDGEEMT